MINTRMSAFNDTALGEPEQDANTALIELDKGLRSSKIGEQCEAIVRFPRLFEKYPFPILINSSLLKLADVFRVGSNFLRVWVLRVCQQSDKHLDKILNVDEFVKRIYSVMHSNDPVARALTLRTLGSVARIIAERKYVHHSIRKSLDCHDLVQVEAAIYAAQMFAAQSKLFAIFMCSKISDMIRGQATPASMKLQLILILQYMHHDISTASMANKLCMELLESYPAAEFVRVTLSASTTLASATLINVPEQVTLLLRYLREDPRLSIKTHALQLLLTLAKKGVHLWPQGALAQLIDSTSNLLQNGTGNINLLIRSLNVIEVLSESPVTCDANMDEGSPLLALCSKACYSPNPIVAVKAVTILSRIACYCYEEGLSVHGVEDLVSCLESLLMLLALDDKNLHQLKVCLQITVKLCQVQRSHCRVFVDAIGSTLVHSNTNNKQNDHQTVVLCEALGAIGSLGENILLPLLPDIIAKIEQTAHTNTKVMLCTLLFQMVANGYEWSADCSKAVQSVLSTVDNWNKYKIARGASRYGHHKIATGLFKVLKEAVASEPLHFWLLGLELMTSAENYLSDEAYAEEHQNNVAKKLNGVIARYASACTCFKAASNPLRNLQFVCDYAKLRCEFFQALVQLLHSCKSLCTAPPYAIAAHEAHTAKDELQRYGRVTSQLRKSVVELKTCAENYYKLYQSAFDADPSSLNNIKALTQATQMFLQMYDTILNCEHLISLQEICLLLAHSVQRVCGGPAVQASAATADTGHFAFSDSTVEMQQLARCCEQLRELAPAGDAASETSSHATSGVSHLRVGCLIAQVTLLAGGKYRLPIPRYLFQTLQSTSVKVSVSPQPRVLGEPVSVSQGCQLALKVEGVLRHGKRASLFRSVAAISINISTALPSKNNIVEKKDILNELEQTVVPHRDFFACEFLLSFGSQNNSGLCGSVGPTAGNGGQYHVTVSANIVDESGNIWKCGPRMVVLVRVHEEPSRKKLS